ncbi:MAG: DUF4124 domain-containing protein [Xanthomonadales bacterium]
MKSTSLPYNDIVKTMGYKHKATLFFTSLLLSAALLVAGSAMAAKVFRWVDENGEVHYSETLPPGFEDKKHDELDAQGIVRARDQSLVPPPPKSKTEHDLNELPRDSSGMKRPKAPYSEAELKWRMDAFLLLRYDSEQEIQDAMTVEINQLEYDRLLLQTYRKSMLDAYRGQIREAATRQRSGVEVDPEIIKSISNLQLRLKSNRKSLANLQLREDGIVANFGAELERYQNLTHNRPEEP